MITEEEQLEALYNGTQAFLEKYGTNDYKKDLQLFTVSFHKYHEYCKKKGLNRKFIATEKGTFDHCYFVQSGDKWLVYYQERGCQFDTKEFTDYDAAFEAAVELSLWDVKLPK